MNVIYHNILCPPLWEYYCFQFKRKSRLPWYALGAFTQTFLCVVLCRYNTNIQKRPGVNRMFSVCVFVAIFRSTLAIRLFLNNWTP